MDPKPKRKPAARTRDNQLNVRLSDEGITLFERAWTESGLTQSQFVEKLVALHGETLVGMEEEARDLLIKEIIDARNRLRKRRNRPTR